jgi:hypothetical protein
MGIATDYAIEIFRTKSGITIPTVEERQLLEIARREAVDLLTCIALEESGIRDGDGFWHCSDPVEGLIADLGDVREKLLQIRGLLPPSKGGRPKYVAPPTTVRGEAPFPSSEPREKTENQTKPRRK